MDENVEFDCMSRSVMHSDVTVEAGDAGRGVETAVANDRGLGWLGDSESESKSVIAVTERGFTLFHFHLYMSISLLGISTLRRG